MTEPATGAMSHGQEPHGRRHDPADGRRLVVPEWAQGRPGIGQGGYSACRFQAALPEPVAINFRSPVPLDTPMFVEEIEGGWGLFAPPSGAVDGAATLIMDAVPLHEVLDEFASTEPVSVEAARIGRSRFGIDTEEHYAAGCFSCGMHDNSMRVQAGPLLDGTDRAASDWTPPEWTGDADGLVAEAVVWTAMDCSQGFFVGDGPELRNAVTVRYAAEIVAPIRVGRRYAVVAFDGRWPGGWDGRKRGAGANIFDEEGSLVARSDSLWLEPRTNNELTAKPTGG